MRVPAQPDADDSRHAGSVSLDHSLHWMAMLGTAGYAWMIHGFWAALLSLLGMLILIVGTNMLILFHSGKLGLVRANRWAWVTLMFGLLAWSGTSIRAA